jgi:hypothetical protein
MDEDGIVILAKLIEGYAAATAETLQGLANKMAVRRESTEDRGRQFGDGVEQLRTSLKQSIDDACNAMLRFNEVGTQGHVTDYTADMVELAKARRDVLAGDYAPAKVEADDAAVMLAIEGEARRAA